MQFDSPILIVEINYSNYIFVAAKYNENQSLQIVEKIITSSEGISNNKITNIDEAQECIKKNISILEDKLSYVFKDVIILIDNFDYTCLNFSGFKKLNGSQLIKENITYILNSLKSNVIENEKDKTILHIFNSKNILDGTVVENIPIGLFGDFYCHDLTFFSIGNNDFKNINQIFKKNNLNIKKILLKDYVEGIELIDQNEDNEKFFKINLGRTNSQISFFDKSSFRYSERFNFGSNMIIKDIEKVCAINNQTIQKILFDKPFQNKKYNEDEFFEEKYFTNINFRKIRKKLIHDIADSRIEEMIDLIFNKNINIKNLKQKDDKIFLKIEDNLISENFEVIFKNYFLKKDNFQFKLVEPDEDKLICNAAKLSFFGWRKEAIPITKTRSSLITRIFNSIFN